jgi:hypothetical protein
MIRNFIGLAAICICFACSNTEKESSNYSMELVKIGEITFPIDNETNKYGHVEFKDWGDSQWFILGNGETNQLKIYDYTHRSLIHTVQFSLDMDGPDRFMVGYFSSFSVLSPDTILSVIDQTGEFILANREGKVFSKVSYPLENTLKSTYPGLHNFFRPVMKDNSLYIPQGWGSSSTENLIFKVDFDAEGGGSVSTLMDWPENISTNWKNSSVFHWKNYPMVYNANTSQFVFSFNASQNLLVTSNFEHFEEFPANSTLISEIKDLDLNLQNDIPKMWADFYQRSFYRSLLYDPYRKVYYRFATIALPPPIDADVQNTRRYEMMSIVVLDEEFNILSETQFKSLEMGKNYIERMSFVGPDGLHMAYMPISEEDEDHEDLLSFDIFILK